MSISFRKLLPNVMRNTRWGDLVVAYQSILNTFKTNWIDVVANHYDLYSMPFTTMQDVSQKYGFDLLSYSGYTSSQMYLLREMETIIPRIKWKTTRTGYEYIYYIFNLDGEVYPIELTPSNLLQVMDTYWSNPLIIEVTSFYLDPTPPDILDSVSGRWISYLDQKVSSAYTMTRNFCLSFAPQFVESSTEYISLNTLKCLYSDVFQMKKSTEVPYFEYVLNIPGYKNRTIYTNPLANTSGIITAYMKSILTQGKLSDMYSIQIGNGAHTSLTTSITGVQSPISVGGDITLQDYAISGGDYSGSSNAYAFNRKTTYLSTDITQGYQEWGFKTAKTNLSNSGLKNDTTRYSGGISVDGAYEPIIAIGRNAQTLQGVLQEINKSLTGAVASFDSTGNGAVKVTSTSVGINSKIVITSGSLFNALLDRNDNVTSAVNGVNTASSWKSAQTGSGTFLQANIGQTNIPIAYLVTKIQYKNSPNTLDNPSSVKVQWKYDTDSVWNTITTASVQNTASYWNTITVPTFILSGVITTIVNKYVIVGSSGEIDNSTDALVWTKQTQADGYNKIFRDITETPTMYIAIGSSGEIETSTDSTTWTKRTPANSYTGDFRSVGYGSGIIIGIGSAAEIQMSSNGSTWYHSTLTGEASNILNKIKYENNQFYIVGNGGKLYQSSGIVKNIPSGIIWKQKHISNQNEDDFYGANIGNGLTFVTGNNGDIQKSYDGGYWTQVSGVTSTNRKIYDTIYSGGIYVAVGYDSASGTLITTSTDATNWVLRVPVTASSTLKEITYGQDKFVTVGTNSEIEYSSDGTTWNKGSIGSPYINDILDVSLSGSGIITCGEYGGVFNISSGNITNINEKNPVYYDSSYPTFNSVIKGSSEYVAVGEKDGSAIIEMSYDGSSWSAETPAQTTDVLNSIDYNNEFVAVGDNGHIERQQENLNCNNSIVFNSNSPDYKNLTLLDNNNILISYVEQSTSTKNGYTIIGTILNNQINFGNPTYCENKKIYSNYIDTLDSSHFVYSYSLPDENISKIVIGETSGTIITFGVPKTIVSGTSNYRLPVTVFNSSYFLMTYRNDSTNALYACVMHSSGISIDSSGTISTITSGESNYFNKCFTLDSNSFYILFFNGGDQGKFVAGSRTGLEISNYGTITNFSSSNLNNRFFSSCIINTSKIAIIYSSDNKGKIRIGEISNLEIVFGEEFIIEDSGEISSTSLYYSDNKLVVTYYADYLSNTKIKFMNVYGLKVNATTIEENIINTSTDNDNGILLQFYDNGKFILLTRDVNSGYANLYSFNNSWSQQTPDNSYTGNFNKVIYGDQFVAVGDNGEIQTSASGTIWTHQTISGEIYTGNLYGAASGGINFISNYEWVESSPFIQSCFFDDNHIIIAYDSKIFAIEAINGIITNIGTAENLTNIQYLGDICKIDSNRFALSGTNAEASGVILLGNISGNSISLGSPYVINNSYLTTKIESLNSNILLATSFPNESQYNNIVSQLISTSGLIVTSYTQPSGTIFTEGPSWPTSAYHDNCILDSSKFVAVRGTSYNAIIGTISGEIITYGPVCNFAASSVSYMTHCATLDSTHFIIAYGTDYSGEAIIGEVVSGSLISFGTPVSFSNIYTVNNHICKIDSSHFIVSFKESEGTSIGKVKIGVYNNKNIISFYDPIVFDDMYGYTDAEGNNISCLNSFIMLAYRQSGGEIKIYSLATPFPANSYTGDLNSIAYGGNGNYVAVGDGGGIIKNSSILPSSGTIILSPISNHPHFGPSCYTTSSSGVIFAGVDYLDFSFDGINWISKYYKYNSGTYFRQIAYGNNIYIMRGTFENNTSGSLFVSSDLINWNLSHIQYSEMFANNIYFNESDNKFYSYFINSSSSSGIVASSSNGLTWDHLYSSLVWGSCNQSCYYKNKYYIATQTGLYSSLDNINWNWLDVTATYTFIKEINNILFTFKYPDGLYVSFDGTNFIKKFDDNNLTGITYLNNLYFLSSATTEKLYYSYDLDNWYIGCDIINPGGYEQDALLNYNNYLFHINYSNSNIYYTDLNNFNIQTIWQPQTPANSYTGNFYNVAYGNNKYMAIGTPNEVQTSDSSGTIWSHQSTSLPFNITQKTGMNFYDGKFIVGGENGNLWYTANDGNSWNKLNLNYATNFNSNLNSIIYKDQIISSGILVSNNQYLSVGDKDPVTNYAGVLTSTSGIVWTSQQVIPNDNLKKIITAGNNYVTLGDQCTYSGPIGNSGLIWTQNASTGVSAGTLNCIAYSSSNNTYVVVGNSGTIRTSNDLTSWISRTPENNYTGNFNKVVWNGSNFVAAGTLGEVQISPNGINWSHQYLTSDTSFNLQDISYGNGIYIVVSSDYSRIYYSEDLDTWYKNIGPGADKSYYSSAYGNGLFVIVGSNGSILTTVDGITLTPRTADNSYTGTFYSVKYKSGLFIALGTNGEIQISPNGITWSHESSPSGYNGTYYGAAYVGTNITSSHNYYQMRLLANSALTTNYYWELFGLSMSTDVLTLRELQWINTLTNSQVHCRRIITERNTFPTFSELALKDNANSCLYYATFPNVQWDSRMLSNPCFNIQIE